jgi:hypothetical protein
VKNIFNYTTKSTNWSKKTSDSNNSLSKKKLKPQISRSTNLHQSRLNGKKTIPKMKIRATRKARE